MERELDQNQHLQDLFAAITALQNPEETARFLRDLCTLGELQALAERWQVVRLVDRNVSYREISRQTGASTATVTRIAHWLRYGEGGYRLLLDRLHPDSESRPDAETD
jgi:TrpR-related protein YerC/YecD